MAQRTAKTKKPVLYTEKQYNELAAQLETANQELANAKEAVKLTTDQWKRTLDVAKKHSEHSDELFNQREKEDKDDNAAELRIIELICKRRRDVQPVLIKNVLNIVRFRMEEHLRVLQERHNEVTGELRAAESEVEGLYSIVLK